MWKLVSNIQVDTVGFTALSNLPVPNGTNNGGYLLPPNFPAYSPIDLLVAGLEVNYIIANLSMFFGSVYSRMGMCISELKIKLTLLQENEKLMHISIVEIKQIIRANDDRHLLTVMERNAPLTFSRVFVK
jgi:hypothetical protein